MAFLPVAWVEMVLITGADGFIGRACVPMLMREGLAVRGIVRTLSTHTAARPEFMAAGDFTQLSEASMRAVLRGTSAVVHLAGLAHRAAASAATLRAVNVDATARFARAAA